MPLDPISLSVKDFCRVSGIGRSLLYEKLATGEIESIKIGSKRLILMASWHRLVAATPLDKPHGTFPNRGRARKYPRPPLDVDAAE